MESTIDNNLNDNHTQKSMTLLQTCSYAGPMWRNKQKKWKIGKNTGEKRECITDNLIKNRSVREYYVRRETRTMVILATRNPRLRISRGRRNNFLDFSRLH